MNDNPLTLTCFCIYYYCYQQLQDRVLHILVFGRLACHQGCFHPSIYICWTPIFIFFYFFYFTDKKYMYIKYRVCQIEAKPSTAYLLP
jgi:hypothetical protein